MITDAALSLLCSFLLFLTFWLVVPIFVLPPLSIYFAFRFYKKVAACRGGSSVLVRVLALIPMAVALAVPPAIYAFFEGTYRA
jgi:hypothetical protein